MRRRSRTWLVSLLLAPALLALAAGPAAAAYFELPDSTWRSTWRLVEFTGGFGTVQCPLTLEGSFHARTIETTRGSLIGSVTRASAGTCTRGSATVLAETLPWHVRYREFSGTLPTITAMSFDLVGAAIRVREPTFGIQCLFTTTAEAPLPVRAATGTPDEEGVWPFSTFRFDESATISTSCGASVRVVGAGTPTVAGGAASVHVQAKPFPGVLGAAQDAPIPRNRSGLVTLQNVAPKGSQRIQIEDITSLDPAKYTINDVNECELRTLATALDSNQRCRVVVTSLVERDDGLLRITYRDPATPQSETVRVESP